MRRDTTPEGKCISPASRTASCAPTGKEGAHDVFYCWNNTNKHEIRKTDNMSPA